MRTIRIGFALACCMAWSSRSLAQDSTDLGFGTGKVGDPPKGWFVPTEGWKAELTDEKSAAGSHVLKLFKPGTSTAPLCWIIGY